MNYKIKPNLYNVAERLELMWRPHYSHSAAMNHHKTNFYYFKVFIYVKGNVLYKLLELAN